MIRNRSHPARSVRLLLVAGALAMLAGTDGTALASIAIPSGRTERFEIPALPARSDGATGVIVIAHGWNSDPTVWANTMRDNIKARLTEAGVADKWDVITQDWRADANTLLPGRARTNAMPIGEKIGKDLLAKGYTNYHFIGHSAGSTLVNTATSRIATRAANAVNIQETFLDPYSNVAANRETLGQHATFAESYVDNRELPLRNDSNPTLRFAYNLDVTRLESPPSADFADQHAWPWKWYTQTTVDPNAAIAHDWGFGKSKEMSGQPSHVLYPRGDRANLGGPNPPPVYNDRLWTPSEDNRLASVVAPTSTVAFNGDGTALTLSTGAIGAASPANLTATSSSNPAWLSREVTIDSEMDAFRFDYEFVSSMSSAGDGWLSVYFDRDNNGAFEDADLIFEESEADGLAGLQSIELPLDEVFDPGTYNLAFRIDAFTSITSSIRIGDVQFGLSVPAPAPIALLASAVFYAIGRRRQDAPRW